ncbi:hypothetical protein C4J81_02120 [Deltaproteobacteria bacterium Smac51]|nr:hypothetical protein C4J81_02120 [Deltaproteobacteria bacterium Smac51]
MLIAHLPAGYLLTKAFSLKFSAGEGRKLWLTGLIASVLPDIDLVFYYLEGGIRIHRQYFTHWPLFWLALLAASIILSARFRKRESITYLIVFFSGIMLHLVLDTVAGPVYWLAPFDWTPTRWVRVPRTESWWLMNLVRHRIFKAELVICGAALAVYLMSAWRVRRLEGAGKPRG